MINMLSRIKASSKTQYTFGLGCAVFVSFMLLLTYRSGLAVTSLVDADGDGTVGANWVVTPSGAHFTAIGDAVRQPTVPGIVDYISINSNRSDTAFFQMSSVGNVVTVSSVTLWVYHNDGANGTIHASLYNASETLMHGTEQSLTPRSTSTWDSATFSGLSLTQGDLDGLRIRFRVTKGGGAASNVKIYAMYASVTHTSGILSVDIVDEGGGSVPSPSVNLSAVNASIDCQASSGTLGTSSQKIRINNTTTSGNWTLAVAATDGSAALWSNGVDTYDFNDEGGAPAGCGDGGDSDTQAGQLTINPSNSTITPQALCSISGISRGTAAAFAQGVADTVTLLSASGSQIACYYDLTEVNLTQQIPGEVPASGSAYTINLTLTVTAN